MNIPIDIARPNRFFVVLTPPSGIAGLGPMSFRETQIESISMPGMSVATHDYELDSYPTFKVPYKRTPEGTFSMSVRLEESGLARKNLKAWIDAAIGRKGGLYYSKYYNDIAGSVFIQQVDLKGKPTFSVNLANAFPINSDSIPYDWGDTNSYVKQTVTFSYFDEI